MKKLFIPLICSVAVFHASGQLTPAVTPVIDQFGVVKSMNSKPGSMTKGSVYLNDEWISSNIHLKQGIFVSDKIENVPLKVDLKTNTLELYTQYGIKVLPLSKVEKFEWIDPVSNTREIYMNCNMFEFNGTRLESFCMVYGENTRLVKHNYLDVIKADFNVALNIGSKEDRIIKKSKLYLLKDTELIQLSKKSLYTVMADKEDKVKQFVKKNHVDFNEEKDLRSIIDYYNSI